MLKKLLLVFIFSTVSLFAINFQTASKAELMSIKGIGEKRAAAIIKYRKTHKIKSAEDLKNIPGIGKEIVNNAKKGIKNADQRTTKTKRALTKAKNNTKNLKKSKEKGLKKGLSSKEKSLKKTKKLAGDKTKRAEKKAKTKAKKSLKKVKEKTKH